MGRTTKREAAARRPARLVAGGVALAAAALLSLPAQAAHILEFRNVVGAWSNAIGTMNQASIPLYVTGNGTPTSEGAWGEPIIGQTARSAFGLNALPSVTLVVPEAQVGTSLAAAPLSAMGDGGGPEVVVGAPPQLDPFTVGFFFHNNAPIRGVPLYSIDLGITADIYVDGELVGAAESFNFHFINHETPNSPLLFPICPYGGANGEGVNLYGCSDRVRVDTMPGGDTFQVGNDVYTLSVAGFLDNGQFSTEFISPERFINVVPVQAQLTYSHTLLPAPNAVPEPGTWLMMILGAGFVGAALRRRRVAATA
jgi:hypothetical protein